MKTSDYNIGMTQNRQRLTLSIPTLLKDTMVDSTVTVLALVGCVVVHVSTYSPTQYTFTHLPTRKAIGSMEAIPDLSLSDLATIADQLDQALFGLDATDEAAKLCASVYVRDIFKANNVTMAHAAA